MMNDSLSNNELEKNDIINFNLIKSDFHKDIIVNVPTCNFELILDAYYFELDNSIKDGEGYDKVIIGITELLNNWILNLKSLNKNSVIYLPIDFSDQYIGGFKVELINDNTLRVNYGFSEDFGFGVFPSNPKEYFNSPKNFQTDDDYPELILETDDFIKTIERNIIRINKNVR